MHLQHCNYCNQDKSKDEFYKSSPGRCKECKDKLSREWVLNHPERNRELQRINSRKHRAVNAEEYRRRGNEAYKKWYRTKGKTKAKEKVKEWRKKNPQKFKAHSLINLMVEFGLLIRPQRCSNCSKEIRLDAHHTDYSKPIDVIWLCRSCHRSVHSGFLQLSQSF